MISSLVLGMRVVVHMSEVHPLRIPIEASSRRYSALVCIQATEPPGRESESLGTRSRTRGCEDSGADGSGADIMRASEIRASWWCFDHGH